MSSSDVTTRWMAGELERAKLTAKRANETAAQWAAEAVDVVLNGGSSTDPASGSGEPIEHVVVWTKDGEEYSSTIRTYQSQSHLDELVTEFKAAVVAAGGTIVSG